MTEIDPAQDGITHINVWSKGKTDLGRLLSNFAHTPFKHPEHGFFASVEAYWYWCASGRSHDELRRLYGVSAKTAGIKFEHVPIPPYEFQDMICEGIRCKIEQTPTILSLFKASKLPFLHYFVYGIAVVDKTDKHRWQLDFLELLRQELSPPEPGCIPITSTVQLADGTYVAVNDLRTGDVLMSESKDHFQEFINHIESNDGTVLQHNIASSDL